MVKMLLKFALVGLSGVGINLAVYAYLMALGANYLVAACFSFSGAVTSNFVWNALWTFRGRAKDKSIRQKYLSFFAISSINLGVNILVLRFLVEYGHAGKVAAQFIAVAVVSGLNFLLNYRITFAEKGCTSKKEVSLTHEPDCYTNLQ